MNDNTDWRLGLLTTVAMAAVLGACSTDYSNTHIDDSAKEVAGRHLR